MEGWINCLRSVQRVQTRRVQGAYSWDLATHRLAGWPPAWLPPRGWARVAGLARLKIEG